MARRGRKGPRANAIFRSVRLVLGAVKPRPFLRPALELAKPMLQRLVVKELAGLKHRDSLRQAMSRAVRTTALATQTHAQRLCPVDTGRLRSSINTQRRTDLYYTIGTNVEYAPTMEFGRARKDTGQRIYPKAKKALAFYWEKLPPAPPRRKGQRRKAGRAG